MQGPLKLKDHPTKAKGDPPKEERKKGPSKESPPSHAASLPTPAKRKDDPGKMDNRQNILQESSSSHRCPSHGTDCPQVGPSGDSNPSLPETRPMIHMDEHLVVCTVGAVIRESISQISSNMSAAIRREPVPLEAALNWVVNCAEEMTKVLDKHLITPSRELTTELKKIQGELGGMRADFARVTCVKSVSHAIRDLNKTIRCARHHGQGPPGPDTGLSACGKCH